MTDPSAHSPVTRSYTWTLAWVSDINQQVHLEIQFMTYWSSACFGSRVPSCGIQFKILRAIANAPWYVTNQAVHTDFNIPYLSDVIHERINEHHNHLEAHPNPLLEPLLQPISGPGNSVGIATELWAGRSGIEPRWGRDFSPVQTGPGAHPASCNIGTGSYPGVKCGRGVLLTTLPLLVPRSWKNRAIPLPTLWATPRL